MREIPVVPKVSPKPSLAAVADQVGEVEEVLLAEALSARRSFQMRAEVAVVVEEEGKGKRCQDCCCTPARR